MIQSASLNTINHKLSDKSSNSNSDDTTSESFIDLLNEIKNENDQQTPNDLISMMNSLYEQMTEKNNQSTNLVEQENNKENEQQTRNDLISMMSTLFENIIDPNKVSSPLLEGKLKILHKTSNHQENINFVKLAKLLAEATVPKQGMQTFQPSQKVVEDQIKAIFSLNKNEKLVEHDFDFQPQFEGKEVIFQSINRNGNDSFATKNDQSHSPRVTVDQFFSEVIGLLKNHTSLKRASEFIEARFSLTPEKLGDIDVKLSIHKGQVFAEFTTETVHGKETLESQISLLRSSLQQQGFQVDKIEISLSGQGLQNSFSGHGEKSRQDQPQQQFSKKKINSEEFYQSHTTIEDYTRSGTENTINILA